MNITLEPMLGAIFGGWELLILLAVIVCFGLMVLGLVGLVVYLSRSIEKPKGGLQPVPLKPDLSKTEVMPRKCPQCGAVLQPDVPEGLCPACLLQKGFATEAGPASEQPSSFVPPPIPELAQLFPQLEILECLGRGGMGAVYKARQPMLDRLVALKILAPEKQSDPQFAERFEREARVLAKLNHPNIVSVFDFGQVQGRYYLIMEYVDGLTLRQVMQAGKMAAPEALALVPKICEALQYAHEQGIVHRDIKPENILMDKLGRVKIADFGIAKIAGVEAKGLSLTGARDVMGTPHYMAPEQVEKPQTVDHRADIYSLGVVFYEMLTGELPLGKFAPPSQKVQVDVRLDEVVLHALEKEPARRYQQASQVKTAVETITGTPAQFAARGPAVPPNPDAGAAAMTVPAVILTLAGVWKLLSAILAVVALLGASTWLTDFIGLGSLMGGWSTVAIISILLFKVLPGVLISYGGYKMLRRECYPWAVAAAVLAIVACSILGLIGGIWALIVLSRDDAKAAFGTGTSAPQSTPAAGRVWGRLAIVLACTVILVPLAIISLAAALLVTRMHMHNGASPAKSSLISGVTPENGEYVRRFNQSFAFNPNGQFSIDNVNGKVEIHSWNSNMVSVAATIHGSTIDSVNAVNIDILPNVDIASVHTDQPSSQKDFSWSWGSLWKNLNQRDATVHYTVYVPLHAQLDKVSTVNGHVSVDNVDGLIIASSVNGDVDVKNASHDLKITTVNGHIKADVNALSSGQFVILKTVNGGVDVGLPDNPNAKFLAKTVNGGIDSDFDGLPVKSEFPLGHHLNSTLGDGTASVSVETVNGGIRILKRSALEVEVPAPSVASGRPVVDDNAIISSAVAWLDLVDRGDYTNAWQQVSAGYAQSVAIPVFVQQMENVRKPMGLVGSRRLQKTHHAATLSGSPDGQYLVMTFNASFTNKSDAVETVTFVLDADDQWKCSGYFIK